MPLGMLSWCLQAIEDSMLSHVWQHTVTDPFRITVLSRRILADGSAWSGRGSWQPQRCMAHLAFRQLPVN